MTKISHLKKILDLKLDLSENFILYFIDPFKNDVLEDDITIQDLAYLYSWDRKRPMKMVFTLMKVSTLIRMSLSI